MDWAGMAEARSASPGAAPNIMNVTASPDVILNIRDSLKFPSSVDVPVGMIRPSLTRPCARARP